MKTFVGFLVLSFALAANGASLSARIVGGSEAPNGKYPYQVALWYSDLMFLCGGSIINERYILTAAHCLKDRTAEELSAHVGSNSIIEGGKRYKVEKLISHAHFSYESTANDIGLIRLSEKIEFSDVIRPIGLASENFTNEATHAVLTGWGHRSVIGLAPKKLQEIELKFIDRKKCSEMLPREVNSNQICTLNRPGQGACNGDSGGPLVSDGFQIGIVSWGVPCAMGQPDVFTRVHAYRDWIHDNMELD